MRDSAHPIAVGTAYLLALFAVDITTQLIDFLSIPIPRHVMAMPGSTGLGALSLVILWPAARFREIPLMSWGGVSLLFILSFWATLEIIKGMMGGRPNFTLVASFLPVLLASQVTRIHYQLFPNVSLLVGAFVNTVIALALLHLFFLLLMSWEMTPSFVNQQELVNRNSISLLLAATIWFVSALDDFRYRFNARLFFLLGVAVLHVVLNHARAAEILLVAGAALFLLCCYIRNYSRQWFVLLMLGAAVIATITFSYPILQKLQLFDLLGRGDDSLSSQIRSETNWSLIRMLAATPLLGVGADVAMNVKSSGYMSHTLYLLVLASYGLLGILPVLVIGGTLLYGWRPEARSRLSIIILLIVIVASFVNDPLIWWGLMFVLAGYSTQAIRVGRKAGVQ